MDGVVVADLVQVKPGGTARRVSVGDRSWPIAAVERVPRAA
jgi:hypothetical protein